MNAAHSGDANRTWNAVETDETRQLDTTAMLQRLERREAGMALSWHFLFACEYPCTRSVAYD